jgi:hypothetical protein
MNAARDQRDCANSWSANVEAFSIHAGLHLSLAPAAKADVMLTLICSPFAAAGVSRGLQGGIALALSATILISALIIAENASTKTA